MWSDLIGINPVAAEALDKARNEELRRRRERADRIINCEDGAIIENLLFEIVDNVETMTLAEKPAAASRASCLGPTAVS